MTRENESGPDAPARPDSPKRTAAAERTIPADRSAVTNRSAVAALPDAELAAFLAQCDLPLRRALGGLVPVPPLLEDARTVVACARIELRRRQARRDVALVARFLDEVRGGRR